MGGIIVVAEHRRGELNPASLETITAARRLKQAKEQPIAVLVMAKDLDQYVAQLKIDGVDEVIKAVIPTEHFQADIYAATLQALMHFRSSQDTRRDSIELYFAISPSSIASSASEWQTPQTDEGTVFPTGVRPHRPSRCIFIRGSHLVLAKVGSDIRRRFLRPGLTQSRSRLGCPQEFGR